MSGSIPKCETSQKTWTCKSISRARDDLARGLRKEAPVRAWRAGELGEGVVPTVR